MKAGLFGGTFNPLHNGHIETTTHIATTFALDSVYFIPSATPPHKSDKELANAVDRLEMVRKSTENLPGFIASDIEIKREGPSYTIDTVRAFAHWYTHDPFLYLIMGSDAFFDITTWHKFREIFDEIALIVMARGGDKTAMEDIYTYIRDSISRGYTIDRQKKAFIHPAKKPIFVSDVPDIDISSTAVRALVKRGESIKQLVPSPVEEMIVKKGLYL